MSESEVLEAAHQEFLAFLRSRGDRVTRARAEVFARVMKRHDHFRADELVAECARSRERVSRGTVYRTLALMEEAGFVHTVRDGEAHRHYEHVYGHTRHDHMVCRRCGRFVEFENAAIGEAIERSCRALQFEADERRLVVFGVCAGCRKTRRRESRP